MVRQSIQTLLKSIKRLAIPFGAVSTSNLMFTFNNAYAKTIGETILEPRGIFLHGSKGKGIIGGTKEVWHNIEYITGEIIHGIDWILALPFSIPKLSADLLSLIYTLLSKIALETPLFIFNNPYLKNTSLTFSLISITIVTILTCYESIMQMLRKEHTDFKQILKRWAIVASVTGFMPFAFEHGFEFLNKLSSAISNLGNFNGGNANGFILTEKLGIFNTLVVILFDLTAISLLIPFALQSGKRWFDLLCLAAISPLALSCAIFDRHSHYFRRWLNEVKSLSLVQLVQSVFILLMGILIFGIASTKGGFFVLVTKLLLVLGALFRLVNPPRLVTSMTGNSDDVFDVYDSYKKSFTNVKNTLTLRNFRPANFIREKVADHKETQGKIKALQQKHNRRYVRDLL